MPIGTWEPPAELREAVGGHLLMFRHRYGEDARFELDALAEEAGTIPAGWVRLLGVETDLLQRESGDVVDDNRSVREHVLALRDEPGAIRLYHAELGPATRPLVDEVMAPVRAAVGDLEGGVTGVSGGLFLGGPGSITPCHPDRHHNVLLQLRGCKHLWVGQFDDPVRNQREVERTFESYGQGPTELPPNAVRLDLGPGDGVYIPPLAFHWVQVLEGDASVALSCGWSTRHTDDVGMVHAFNLRFRQRTHLQPRLPGKSPFDGAKARIMRSRMTRLGVSR